MIACPDCPGTFAEPNDAYNHIKAKHGASKARRFRRDNMQEREPSIGSELADALLSVACGEDVDEHIALMFPNEIAEYRRRLEEGA